MIKKKLLAALTKIRLRLNIRYCYKYKNFSIELPADHMLPIYKNLYPKYDSFLPHFSNYLGNKGTVIDIGANVGDTLAGMLEKNSELHYLCIEADDNFYKLLEGNIEKIKKFNKNIKVKTVKKFIGISLSNVVLQGANGSKHAVECEKGQIEPVALDLFVENYLDSEVVLLKSDVDGFDYDVINSSFNTIKKYNPAIFFELQLNTEQQKTKYEETIKSLGKIGYCHWIIFDNFGEKILETESMATLFQLMNYLWNQKVNQIRKSIYYFDVLAAQKTHIHLITDALEKY